MKTLFVLLNLLVSASPAFAQIDSARALFRQHRYREAEAVVHNVLRREPRNRDALLERARLYVQAWRLDMADSVTRHIGHNDVDALLLHGRIQLLRKHYAEALESAHAAQRLSPRHAGGFLLEADVRFWEEKPELAEAPLERALGLNPNHADARFAYGYAIWRRVDAQQLHAMAEQWNQALRIEPLHYVTHWHFGNGHTHLTYADYAQPGDSAVRVLLRGADSLVAQERVHDALTRVRDIERNHPESLIAPLARGSIFYSAYNLPRAERLDSAQAIFQSLLARKTNYGPAHNGLAAIIKQRQLEYVANHDSLEAAIAAEPLPNDSAFQSVFKDLSYYPGDRVERMARQQLGPALAYVPFLARLGYTYTVQPLHRDLAEALGRPFFRTSTTFDNRQWMDIRGAGGNHAAAGIEYVERGSHQERVVLLHEYVHQWHGAVLTDLEKRRIRQLYNDAMAKNRTLDYYSANNESEFFAQAYEAYLSPVKVHPLNHKAMNTRGDLIRKDPQLFAFLDTLITRNRAYLAGNRDAMKSNWAQVYVTLASRTRNQDSAAALVDTALAHDASYTPALLQRVAILRDQKRWADAEQVLHTTEKLAPRYGPVLKARAQLLLARAHAENREADVEQLADLYKRALAMESDLAERAELNTTLRELYRDNMMFSAAISIAIEQMDEEPAPSTYLRDQKDNAAAFIANTRARTGGARGVLEFFADLLKRKPQHFVFRAMAAGALLDAGSPADALAVLEEGEKVLRAGGQKRDDFAVLRTVALARIGRAAEAADARKEVRTDELSDEYKIRLLEYDASVGKCVDLKFKTKWGREEYRKSASARLDCGRGGGLL